SIVLACYSSWFLFEFIPANEFRGIGLIVTAIFLFYVYLIIVYRLFLKVAPLKTGEIQPHTRQELIHFIYLLFFLMGFHPLIRSNIVPVPLMRFIYICLCAKLGDNTYPAGVLADPIFTKIGKNCV